MLCFAFGVSSNLRHASINTLATQTRVIDAKSRPVTKVVLKKNNKSIVHTVLHRKWQHSVNTQVGWTYSAITENWGGFAKDTVRWQYPLSCFPGQYPVRKVHNPSRLCLSYFIEGCFPPGDTLFFRTVQISEHYYYASGSCTLPFSSFWWICLFAERCFSRLGEEMRTEWELSQTT